MKRYSDNRDVKLSIAFWLILFLYNIDFTILHILNEFNLPQMIGKLIHWGIYLFVVITWVKYARIKSKIATGMCVLIMIMVMCISYLINPDLKNLISNHIVNIFIVCIPYLAVASSICDYEELMSNIYKVNILSNLMLILMMIFALNGASEALGYNYMSISYNMLIGAIINLYCALKQKKVLLWILFVLEMSVLVIVGARGTIICIGVFSLLYFFRTYKLYSLQAIKIYSIGVGIIFCGMLFYHEILNGLISILQKNNIQSRNIELLLNGSISSSTTRNYILEHLLNFIELNPVYGYGVFADRLLNQSIGYGNLRGSYAHNIFIELIINFGIPIGIMSALILVVGVVKGYLKSSYNKSIVISMIICMSVVKLQFTSSYIIDQYFYVLIGVLIGINNYTFKTMKRR